MNWQTISGIVVIIGFITGAFGFFFKKLLPAIRTASRVADKVTGVPANPRTGQDAVPGLFERLDHQDTVLETIRHEVEFNNGSSVKDGVMRTEAGLAAQAEQLKTLAAQLEAHLAAVAAVTTTINVNPGSTP
jgi:hypothetical protein